MKQEKTENLHAGHRARIRERFRREGLDAFSEHEVLELLLTFSIPHRDVNPLAHSLIDRFGSLSGVLDADEGELMRIGGVGENTAVMLTLMPRLFGIYQRSSLGAKPIITNPQQARQYCTAFFHGVHDEMVYMICLDQRGAVLHPAPLHRGTVNEVPIYPRMLVETALRHHAHAVLLVHNHPSGSCEPSAADYETTRLCIYALSVISVSLVDHLIIAGQDVYSMLKDNPSLGVSGLELSYIRSPKDRLPQTQDPASNFISLRLRDDKTAFPFTYNDNAFSEKL